MATCLDGAPCGVKVLNIATGAVTQIGSLGKGGTFPAWSPDGSRIVFSLSDGIDGLYLASADGGVVTQLVPGRNEAAPSGAAWSPGGDMIVFLMWDFSGNQQPQIYLINADGTGLRLLTEGSWPIWSPVPSGVQGDNTNIQMLPWGLLKAQWRQLMYRAAFSELALLGGPFSFQN